MASLLAASRQDLAAAYGLHARAKSVRLSATALARLICALWQSNPPLWLRVARGKSFTKSPNDTVLAASAAVFESTSVLWPLTQGQETQGVAWRGSVCKLPRIFPCRVLENRFQMKVSDLRLVGVHDSPVWSCQYYRAIRYRKDAVKDDMVRRFFN